MCLGFFLPALCTLNIWVLKRKIKAIIKYILFIQIYIIWRMFSSFIKFASLGFFNLLFKYNIYKEKYLNHKRTVWWIFTKWTYLGTQCRSRRRHQQTPLTKPLCMLPSCPSPDTISMKHQVLSVGILVLETSIAYFLCAIDATMIQENFQNSDLQSHYSIDTCTKHLIFW